jgi:hypothetical protein
MDAETLKKELSRSQQVIDITTTGRVTGKPHRHEIRLHIAEGQLYITGSVGGSGKETGPNFPRDWYRNMVATNAFILHLKGDVRGSKESIADFNATASPLLDPEERRAALVALLANYGHQDELDLRVAQAPLVQVTLGAEL